MKDESRIENKSLISKPKIAEDIYFDDYKIDFDKYGSQLLNWNLDSKDTIKPIEIKKGTKGFGLNLEEKVNEPKKEINNVRTTTLYGSKVKLILGKHKGLKGILLEDTNNIKSDEKYKIQLKNGEIIMANSNEFKFRSSEVEETSSKKISKAKIKSEITWLQKGLKVRVVSKEKNGSYYNKIGIIVSIHNKYNFTLKLDKSSSSIDDLDESEVEPYISQEYQNVTVIIIRGKYKEEKGQIVAFDSSNNKYSILSNSTFEILEVEGNNICEIINI